MVPGSAAAKCNQIIDLVLSIEAADVREQFVNSLAAFESEARRRYGKELQELLPHQIDTLLAGSVGQGDKDHPFEVIKEWIADTYWSSQDGLRALGWNGQMAWTSYPACSAHK